MFKLVRLIGRLPRLHYLLAFDEETLLSVLTETDIARGRRDRALAYLDKIVQLRFDLPPIDQATAGQMIDRILDEQWSAQGIRLSDGDIE
jgi:predicted KAP-like P-loop ATPase